MSLKRAAVSGVKWSGVATVITTILQFAQLAVLANLLEPGDFGLFALARIILGLALAVSDVGISNAIIQNQAVTRNQLSSLYWLNIGAGLLLFFVLWGGAPFIAWLYEEPELTPIIFWIALTFLFAPLGQQFQMLMQKELRFKALGQRQVVAAFVGTAVAIGSAFLGWGIYSLVWGQLCRTVLLAILYAQFGWVIWRPHFYFRFGEIKSFLQFGLYQMGERTVNYFAANVDYIIIGWVFGKETLGLYSFAYELILRPLQVINPVIVRVAFPLFSKKQTDNNRLRYGYTQIITLLSTIMCPIFVGIFFTAQLFVPLIFDPKWIPSILFIQILTLVGFLKAIANPSGSILLAKGRADLGFYWNILIAVINSIVFGLFSFAGPAAVAYAYGGLSILYAFATWYLIKWLIDLSFKDYLQALFPPILMGGAMGLVVFGSNALLRPMLINDWMLLIALVGAGIGSYMVLLYQYRQSYVQEMVSLLK